MINIDSLLAEAKANEPRVLYESYVASGATESEWTTTTLIGGGSAKAVVAGKTITLYYADGTVDSYTAHE